jgi:hypothetical protein
VMQRKASNHAGLAIGFSLKSKLHTFGCSKQHLKSTNVWYLKS